MAFETFDLGKVIAAAEGIKGMRRQAESDRLRDAYTGALTRNVQQSGQIAQSEHQATVDARTARTRYLEAEAIERAADPVKAAREFAPDLIAAFEKQHGAGAFDQLPPDAVKKIAAVGKEKAAAAAGIFLEGTPEQRYTTQAATQQAEALFTNQQQLEGIRHRNELEQISATGAENRKTAEISAPGKAMKGAQSLRKEFEGMDAVKNYRTVEPILASVKKAPDTGYGDMDLIYGVGKILDPGSVVRDSEMTMAIRAGSPLQQLLGTTRFSIEKGGRLTPQARRQIVGMLEGRVGALEDAYNRERQRFSTYATENGFEPSQVVGGDDAEQPSAGGAVQFIYVPGQGVRPANAGR